MVKEATGGDVNGRVARIHVIRVDGDGHGDGRQLVWPGYWWAAANENTVAGGRGANTTYVAYSGGCQEKFMAMWRLKWTERLSTRKVQFVADGRAACGPTA